MWDCALCLVNGNSDAGLCIVNGIVFSEWTLVMWDCI